MFQYIALYLSSIHRIHLWSTDMLYSLKRKIWVGTKYTDEKCMKSKHVPVAELIYYSNGLLNSTLKL